MKVYELISALSKCSAGAEVEFQTTMTLKEFSECEVADCIDGKDLYTLPGKIQEVVEVDSRLVVLYR